MIMAYAALALSLGRGRRCRRTFRAYIRLRAGGERLRRQLDSSGPREPLEGVRSCGRRGEVLGTLFCILVNVRRGFLLHSLVGTRSVRLHEAQPTPPP